MVARTSSLLSSDPKTDASLPTGSSRLKRHSRTLGHQAILHLDRARLDEGERQADDYAVCATTFRAARADVADTTIMLDVAHRFARSILTARLISAPGCSPCRGYREAFLRRGHRGPRPRSRRRLRRCRGGTRRAGSLLGYCR